MPSNADGNPEPDRKGGCILTYTGKVVYPLDPRSEEIDIYDIAHALANICRYTGHVERYYSVAEHSVRVSEWAEEKVARAYDVETAQMALEGLMHDASEAYLGDVARPIKQSSYVGKLYSKAEDRLMEIIAEKYGTTWPIPSLIAEGDHALLRTEQRDLMPYPNSLYSLDEYDEIMLPETIDPWSPEEAEIEFLDRYAELAHQRLGLSQV